MSIADKEEKEVCEVKRTFSYLADVYEFIDFLITDNTEQVRIKIKCSEKNSHINLTKQRQHEDWLNLEQRTKGIFSEEYIVNVVKEDGEFIAACHDFPEAVTSGTSYEEALEKSADALEEAIAGRIKHDEEIPQPSKNVPGEKVSISPQIAMKASLYFALKKKGLNNSQFAKLFGCDEKEVRRLIDPLHNTQLKRLNEALRELYKREEE